MIKTLLIDLDDTLLENDMERFLPAYLQKIGEHFSNLAAPDRIANQVMAGTLAMIQNLDPTRTLQEIFAEIFYPSLGVSEERLRPKIDEFYTQVFPTLRSYTDRREIANQLVKAVRNAGLDIVIATSPLFPLTAIEQRLAWAGLDVEAHEYALIASYETFHFAKPHTAYYAEILGRLGTSPHEAAMIGNDISDDMIPAQTMGMAVFHISPSPRDFPGGDLQDAISWLEVAHTQSHPEAVDDPEVLLARLRGHLAALLSLSDGLRDQDWSKRQGDEEWAPNEIVCHMRDVENEVNLPRVRSILTQHEPYLSAFDTDQWAEERDYLCQSGLEALNDFSESRLQVIAELASLKADRWSRPARHSLFGPTSLAEVLRIVTDHDLLHLAQLRSTLAMM
ncbi:MAG: HAD family hydrolase [Anaerolineales bacterium]|nr:HAD family hydrolase [Anaerolineales bacterium]